MRKAFVAVAALLMLAVVVQFFLAGSGAFDSAPVEEAFKPHRGLGYVTVLLAVLLTVVALVVRMPGRLIGLSGLVAGLGVLQPVIAVVAKAFGDSGDTTTTAGKLVFGLHAVNGLVMVAVVRNLLRQSRQLTNAASTPRAGAGDDAPAAGPAAGPARTAS